jgi:PIN domain
MRPQVAVIDANILYVNHLRNFFMRLASLGGIRIHWTTRIEDEWIGHLAENRPDIGEAKLRERAAMMNQALPDALVTGHEYLEETLRLDDPKDRHVLAAAIHTQADVIITNNLKDFPAAILEPYDIMAVDPDSFTYGLLLIDPRPVIRTVIEIQRTLKKPPMSMTEVLDILEKQGMVQTVAWLRDLDDEHGLPLLA